MHRIRPHAKGGLRASIAGQPASRLPHFLALTVGLPAVCVSIVACGAEQSAPFVSEVRFDTVVVVGGAAEQRPLLLYKSPVPRLVDDSTVAYSDAEIEGRLVTVNLLSGEGWEVFSSPGAEGPGEFGGAQPIISPSRGIIHTVTPVISAYNAWTREGVLVADGRYSDLFVPLLFSGFGTHIVGMMGPRVVVKYGQLLDDDLVRQSIRIYDDHGLITEVSDGLAGIADYEIRRVPGEGTSVRTETINYVPLIVAARGETVVWGVAGNTLLTVLNADGSKRGSRELETPVSGLRLDNDERVWAITASRDVDGNLKAIVLDRDLNILFHAGVRDFIDASGDYVLSMAIDEFTGGRLLTLLKMERVR